MEILTSRTNPTVKSAAALKDSAERKKTGLFLLEGARLCFDACVNGNEIKALFVTENAKSKYKKEFETIVCKAEKTFLISESISEKLSDTKNSQQFFCVCKEKDEKPQINYGGIYIFTDNIQNPDNLGAIVRTAEALGADGIIINGGCDIYSPKACRASMGAFLRFPVIRTKNPEEILTKCKQNGMSVLSSVVDKDAESITDIKTDSACILVIGNEGNGVSDEVLSLSTKKVTIPMPGKAESLNAFAAATILMWEVLKR